MQRGAPEPQIRFVRDSAGRSIAYAVAGAGPVVICPPWWVSHVAKDWQSQDFRSFFSRLGDGLTLVRYDRLGLGLSDRTASAQTLDGEEEQLALVADAIGADTYGLFAMSCGGPIAIRHAAKRPGRVDRICFYGSFLNGGDIGTPELRQALLGIVRAHWGVASRAISDIFFPDAPRDVTEEVARLTRASADSETAAKLLQLTYSMDATGDASSVTAGCLVIHRHGDRAVPFDAGRALASRLAGAQFTAQDGNNHPAWIGGDAVAALANAFLRGGEAAPPKLAAESDRLRFDRASRAVIVSGKPVPLTRLEFGVMCELADHAGQVVSRDDLLHRVWQQPFEGSNRIDVVIAALRRKLGVHSGAIATVIGHGYRFDG